jgi:hypothetical protein
MQQLAEHAHILYDVVLPIMHNLPTPILTTNDIIAAMDAFWPITIRVIKWLLARTAVILIFLLLPIVTCVTPTDQRLQNLGTCAQKRCSTRRIRIRASSGILADEGLVPALAQSVRRQRLANGDGHKNARGRRHAARVLLRPRDTSRIQVDQQKIQELLSQGVIHYRGEYSIIIHDDQMPQRMLERIATFVFVKCDRATIEWLCQFIKQTHVVIPEPYVPDWPSVHPALYANGVETFRLEVVFGVTVALGKFENARYIADCFGIDKWCAFAEPTLLNPLGELLIQGRFVDATVRLSFLNAFDFDILHIGAGRDAASGR